MRVLQSSLISLALYAFFGVGTSFAAGFSVTPESIELRIVPGDVSTNYIKVTNFSDKEIKVSAEAKDIAPSGEESEFVFTDDPTYALTPWIKVTPEEFTLVPKGFFYVEFRVSVPKEATSGGRFGAVRLYSEGLPEKTSVIMLNVPGGSYDSPEVVGFYPSSYVTFGPTSFTLRLLSDNPTFVKAMGEATIYDLSGQVVATIAFPPKNILAQAIRKIDLDWGEQTPLGVYRVELTGNSDRSPSQIRATTWVVGLMAPAHVPLVAAGILIIVSYILRRQIRWILVRVLRRV